MSDEAAAGAAEGGSSMMTFLPIVGIIVGLLFLALRFVKKSDKVTELKPAASGAAGAARGKRPMLKLNPQADSAYLANCLRPDSTPLDVLFAIATTPDSVAITEAHMAVADDVRAHKVEWLKKKKEEEEKAGSMSAMNDLLADDGGWAEDDEDDPAAQAAKKAKEEKKKEAAALAKATGKDVTDFTRVALEGIDEGVLGQKWVEGKLKGYTAWPPPNFDGTFGKKRFLLPGTTSGAVAPMDHPAVRRNLVMTMGRLNAKSLNTHPELAAAGPAGKIDPTYFKATMEYRQRAGMLLEASLRVAAGMRSFTLANNVLDAIVMFKIGIMDVQDAKELHWFETLMTKQYGSDGSPKLIVDEKRLGAPTAPPPTPGVPQPPPTPGPSPHHDEIATGDRLSLEMQITRRHAESFTKEKVAQCQRQGIPPQVAMQAYREGWFIMIRGKRIDETTGAKSPISFTKSDREKEMEAKNPLFQMLDDKTKAAFGAEVDKFAVGWPFVISNVAQKSGKVKIHFPAPATPGKYEFVVTIKSQDFLGLDEEFSLEADVVDKETVDRQVSVPEVKQEEKEEDDEDEGKKDK